MIKEIVSEIVVKPILEILCYWTGRIVLVGISLGKIKIKDVAEIETHANGRKNKKTNKERSSLHVSIEFAQIMGAIVIVLFGLFLYGLFLLIKNYKITN